MLTKNKKPPRGKKPDVSLIIPCFNESKNVLILAKKIDEAFSGTFSYEVFWVDDGSTDNTTRELKEISKKYSQQNAIILMRRVGQSTALMAGINKARGRYIATMDGDVQNDPDELPQMLKKLQRKKLDMIVGWRVKRWEDEKSRRGLSLIANTILRRAFTSVDIHDAGCPVKIAKAKIFKNLSLYGELHRFISYIAGDMGAKIGEVKIKHRARMHGSTKYGMIRIFKVIMDILALKFLTMKKTTPLQFMGVLIIGLYGLSFLNFFAVVFLKFSKNMNMVRNPLLLLTVLLFLVGTIVLMMGLLGELIVRAYYEGSGKKNYMVRKRYGNK